MTPGSRMVFAALSLAALAAGGALLLRRPSLPAPAPPAPAAPATSSAPDPPPPSPVPAVTAGATTSHRGGPMVRVPAGRIPRCFAYEEEWCCGGPDLEVGGFEIDRAEVTVGDYEACVAAGACDVERLDAYHWCNWHAKKWGRTKVDARHPINCVSPAQAEAYCGWAGKRLPTLDEWSYAARGPEARRYPWPSQAELDIHEALVTGGCWRAIGTCPVGERSPPEAPFGLQDMAGNVAEWVSASECDIPRRMRGGICHYPDHATCKPRSPVACGTSWEDPLIDLGNLLSLTKCRAVQHDDALRRGKGTTGDAADQSVGFRCARSVPAVPPAQ